MRIPFRHRLAYRQAMNTVLIAFVLGGVLSGLQVGYDLFKEREQVDATVSQIIGMFRESAGQAVFNVDHSMIRTVINGLFEYRPIREIRIIDEFDAVLASESRGFSGSAQSGGLRSSGKTQSDGLRFWVAGWLVRAVFGSENEYTFPLFHKAQKEPVGRLRIRVDNHLVAANFFRRAGLVIVSGLVRNIVLSGILTLFFYASLTRPLLVMVRQVASVKPSDPAEKKIAIPESHGKDEMGLLARTINHLLNGFARSLKQRRAAEKELEKHRDRLEQMVGERTAELRESLAREHDINAKLNQAIEKVEAANRDIMGGIRYAKMIQTSLLPPREEVARHLPHSFSIWMPKEVVGGDIFFMDFFEGGLVAAMVDCTGHGVPGALMSMIACSGLKRVVRDEGHHDPSEILRRLDLIVRESLRHGSDAKTAKDGLDAAICFAETADPSSPRLTYAGAKLHLLCVHEGEEMFLKGDRQGVGYKRSDPGFVFTNHVVELREGAGIYLFTDGFEDQLGGKKGRRFGRKRLRKLIVENSHLPFERQRENLLHAFHEHRGENETQDDVTVLGFRLW